SRCSKATNDSSVKRAFCPKCCFCSSKPTSARRVTRRLGARRSAWWLRSRPARTLDEPASCSANDPANHLKGRISDEVVDLGLRGVVELDLAGRVRWCLQHRE